MSERYWVLVHLHELSPPEAIGPFDRDAAEAFIEKHAQAHFSVGLTLVREVGEGEDEQDLMAREEK